MIKSRLLMAALFLLIIFLSPSVCFAAVTNTWTGSTDPDWFTVTNWSQGVVPTNGHHVIIDSIFSTTNVLLTNSTASLASFVITNRTLTFTNWTTTLNASNVMIKSGGKITHSANTATTTNESGIWVPDGRVHIVCTNLTIATNGAINANDKGYAGGNSGHYSGYGPGGGGSTTRGAGGGYGGKGGDSSGAYGGTTYGLTNAPTDPGSGGGSGNTSPYYGGAGGGAIRIEASGTVTIHGLISANGADGNSGASHPGGGSGGAIYITCEKLAGSTNGLLGADGGRGYGTGASGGGGRIAVVYDQAAQAAAPNPGVRFSTAPGTYHPGEDGTVYLPDSRFLSETLSDQLFMNVRLFGITNWSVGSLTVSNCVVTFREEGLQLTVTNALYVGSGGSLGLDLANSTLECGSITLTNGGTLYVYSGATNATTTNYGALVSVTGDVWIASSSWIYPYSHETDGGSAKFQMKNLRIAPDGGFNADGRGFSGATSSKGAAFGPGAPSTNSAGAAGYGAGAGYGGKGGSTTYGGGQVGGPTYGSSNAPVSPGSGGGSGNAFPYYGGNGGGLIWIEASENVTMDGTITAYGGNTGSDRGGGGSGGGIFITCEEFAGSSNALLSAKGGNGTGSSGGGGGGGRIAIGIGLSEETRNKLIAGEDVTRLQSYDRHPNYAGVISATNGVGTTEDGAPGTKLFLTTNYLLTITGNPANYGSPTPDDYGTTPDYADNAWITNTVNSPVDEGGGLRRTCLGWATAISNSTSTQAVFQLTTNLVLTWNWTNEYELTVSSGNTNRGTVNTNVNGWYTNGVEVSGITATGTNEYEFLQWTGDVPEGSETNRPLTVTMDQARTITAQFYSLEGETKTWNGSGNWTSATNWAPGGMPGPYDDVIIESGSVLLSESRGMASLTVSNTAILTFTNWSTTLSASNVTVQSEGTIGIASCFTDTQMSNRVHIVCMNLTIATNGAINADYKGYSGATSLSGAGYGPGGPPAGSYGGGAGYGGRGAHDNAYGGQVGGVTYGSLNAPAAPGSGGGSGNTAPYYGGDGGGLVWIEATANVTVNGTVTANGGSAGIARAGGGSGGGIFITCEEFDGSTNGLLSADGGTGSLSGGGGGGGRIAVIYNEATQTNRPGVRFSTDCGSGGLPVLLAEIGTVYLANTLFLTETLADELFMNVRLFAQGFTNWAPENLTMSDCILTFGEEGFQLIMTNALYIGSGACLTLLENSLLSCGGNMTLTNGGSLYVYSGITNAANPDYGALVNVAGDVFVGANSWIYPYSELTNGGSVKFQIKNLTIANSGGFNADAKGYSGAISLSGAGYGPGGPPAGGYGAGGGYGGMGGSNDVYGSYQAGGPTYGQSNAPAAPGSGGGSGNTKPYYGGNGGGAVRIEASANVTVDGTITANGASYGSARAGGGSGGGIFVTCEEFDGSTNGLLSVKGGTGNLSGGGGGGGRIAVWYAVPESERQRIIDGDLRRVSITNDYSEFLGTVSVTNGAGGSTPGKPGNPGTCIFLTVGPPAGTMFMCK